VVLAYLKPEDLAGVFENIRLTKFTPKTVVSKTELLSELERIREDGYALTDQQWTMDTLAIAAPIVEGNGEVRASVCITGSRLSPAFRGLRSLIVSVKEAGREISKSLTRVPVLDGQAVPAWSNSPYGGMRDIKTNQTGMFQGRRPIASITN
jgi:DNA-binding IclR family transcriptional regulator